MHAVRFDHYGDVDVLEIVDVEKPSRVRIRCVSRSGRLASIRARPSPYRRVARAVACFPEGEGSDLAGIVDAVGPGVTAFVVGDEALGYTNSRASHAEFVLTGSDEIVAKPPALSWPEAGALFVVGTSAYALVHTAEVAANDVVLGFRGGGRGRLARVAMGGGIWGLRGRPGPSRQP